MILLDTHVLLWWINGDKKLPKKISKEIEAAAQKNTLVVSAISVWEICLLVKKGRLHLNLPVETWIEKVEALSLVRFVPIDNRIAKTSVFLPGMLHRDPADRLIISTALIENATIVTADKKILGYKSVKSIW